MPLLSNSSETGYSGFPIEALPPVALLAGGKAERMRPLTDSVPKSLLPVAGQPFIAHQLALLRREGAEKVVLCVGHLGGMLQDYVGDGRKFGLAVEYSFDGAVPLGTGGALKRALPLLGDSFLVLYGDSYLDIAFAPVVDGFRASGKPGLMTVFRNENRWDGSNVDFDGQAIRRYDKRHPTPSMQHIDYGLGILAAAAFDPFADDQAFDLAELYAGLADRGALAGFEVYRRFYEIGSKAGLAETERYLSEGNAAGKGGTD